MLLLLAISTTSYAQLKAGNKALEKLSYVEALNHYENFLEKAKPDDQDIPEALSNLAFCYKHLQDFKNSERVYRRLFEKYENILDSKEFLRYAQVLASNSKYRESQLYYSKYGERQTSDVRAKNFTVAYMDKSPFYRDSSLYKIEYVNALNTVQADFSPMYHGKGLVFVSARNDDGIIKRVFMNNQTPFLDLFEYPDTTSLVVGASGGSAAKVQGAPRTNQVERLEEMEMFSKRLNSKYHEGPLVFFNNQNQIVFTRNNHANGRTRKSEDGINKLKLFTAKNDGKKWDHIEELPFNSDDYSCGHPALNQENTKLYFVSDMPGGYGGTDLYVVEYNNGDWGVPVNMGKDINTEGDEMFPFVDENDNLYFASNGHAGLGGLDIFYVELENDNAVAKPENLGSPINSAKDDFGLITNGDRSSGFFSSNRLRGYSDDNIYAFSRKCRELKILVYDAITEEPLADTEVRLIKSGVNQDLHVTDATGEINVCMATGLDFEFRAFKEGYETNSVNYATMITDQGSGAQIKIYLQPSKLPLVKGTIRSELTNEPIAGATVILTNEKDETTETVITGKDGRYEFQPTKKGKYVVSAVKHNYATNTEKVGKVKPKKTDNVSYEQNLGMIAEGDIFRIENIYYDYGKSSIRRDARKELLNTVLPVLKKYPQMVIEIRSHTDSRSSSDFNQELSEQRAQSVVDFLSGRGIETSRMIATGFGETMLVNECGDGVKCSESKHQQNRRTEFKVLNVSDSSTAKN
ncbi:carboxypeptidase regulatory-like domain-containing protein [Jiulongibacter sp. NS-SX5]|uniref:carboxypeptidase regulatory-like domain-containing protein n=1 Tax=Jiulongibacter sp. NS-SX5 TaxID=3463854 RepID=UPI004058E1A3